LPKGLFQWDQGRNEGGHISPGANSLWGALNHCGSAELLREAPKSPNNVTSTFFNTVNLLPKELRFDHWAPNLFVAPGAI